MTAVSDNAKAISGADETEVATLRFRTVKGSLTLQFMHSVHNTILAAHLTSWLMFRSPGYLDSTRPSVTRHGSDFTGVYDPRLFKRDQIMEWIDLHTRYELAE